MRIWRILMALGFAAVVALASCADEESLAGTNPGTPSGTGGGAGAGTVSGTPTGTSTGAPVDACDELGLAKRELDTTGPFGVLRHDLADDFALPLLDGSEWRLSEQYTGCDSYVFIPSGLRNSGLDNTSIWARDLDRLIEISPRNVHYFFVPSRLPADAPAELEAMRLRIDEALAPLDAETQDWWRERLHLVAQHRIDLADWPGAVLTGLGTGGFAIDRQQRVRTVGNFADVDRFRNDLYNAGHWPWEANLAYASYEVRHHNYEAQREEYLASQQDVTVVTAWDGEVLAEVVETTIDLPTAQEMAAFDTFEIDLTMDCPDPDDRELGNCGAWDYLAHIHLLDDDGQSWIELARFITTYHREGRYLVDATPMLVLLRDGGPRQIRYTVSPPWNPQAYLTRMDFRFSNLGKPSSPSEATFLFSGGSFNSTYNDAYQPVDVAIPAGASKVELWAIITGHGGAAYNCAEFCNHQHEFTVNGVSYTEDHPAVGNDEGCLEEIDHGVVPNQGGTWWFGRGGWCPGQQVEPWVVDVTGDVTAGETATVSYQGLFNDQTPPDDAGNIHMTSYLVVYE